MIRVHEGVYRVGHCAPNGWADAQAAVLACGEGAVLFGRAAASLWTIRPLRAGEPIEVAVPRRLRQPDIRTVVRDLPRHHVATLHGIRVTTPARAAFDLATLVSRKEFERAVNQVQVLKLATKPQLLALLEEVRGRPGAPALAAALHVDGATRSGGEDALWRLLVRSGLPLPTRNGEIEGWEGDLVWADLRLVAELDSHQYHDTAAQFEQDHQQDRGPREQRRPRPADSRPPRQPPAQARARPHRPSDRRADPHATHPTRQAA